MAQHEGPHILSAYPSYASSVRFHPTTLPPTVSLLTVFSLLACDQASHAGDTTGLQSYGRWEWHGRVGHAREAPAHRPRRRRPLLHHVERLLTPRDVPAAPAP